jgi:EF-hand domain-containing protein 1
LYFLEDDTISVIEPPVENSGISQGVLVKRQKLAKDSGEYFTPKDFNIAQNVTFYGKTFRIVSCDKFTQNYMTKVGIALNPSEPMPADKHQESRVRVQRVISATPLKKDKLVGFLEKDRMVLRFYCAWDDRVSKFGELREFVMLF